MHVIFSLSNHQAKVKGGREGGREGEEEDNIKSIMNITHSFLRLMSYSLPQSYPINKKCKIKIFLHSLHVYL